MQTTCSRNHIYDSDQYASCPYCNRGTRAIFFDVGGNGNTTMPGGRNTNQRTVAPGGQDGCQRTVAPGGQDAGQRNGDIGPTEIPDYMKIRMEEEKKSKTIGVVKKKTGLDPVVGWLVCIEGPEKGKDYRLFNRINSIGRAESNDVVITADQTISQENHARVAYDGKHNNYQLIPGNGKNIVYLNDVPTYYPQMLYAYDVIDFGETKLLFIPLCTDKFQWKQEAKG